MVSRYECFKVISDNLHCTESCPYTEFCPHMMEGVKKEICIIRQHSDKLFDKFYNLYLGEYTGIKSEMIKVAYQLRESCDTPEEMLSYFNALVKILSNCYSNDKKSEEIISEIFLNVSPLKGESPLNPHDDE